MPFNWSVLKRLGLLAAIAVACPASASADFNLEELMRGNIPPYTVRSGHPRLFITPENKALLVQRITGSDLGQTTFQHLIATADNGIGTDFSAIPKDLNNRSSYPQFAPFIEAYAILHQLGPLFGVPEEEPAREHVVQGFKFKHGLQRYRQKGIEAYQAFLNHPACVEGSNYAKYTELATGYDWLYDQLNEEQRKQAIQRMVEATAMVWPFDANDDAAGAGVTGHGFNSPYGLELILPAAFAGDNVTVDLAVTLKGLGGQTTSFTNSDAAASYMLEVLLTKTLWGPTGSLTRFYRLSNGVTEEEIGYSGRYNRFFPTLEGWYTATGQDFWQVADGWKRYIQWHLYDALPHTEGGPGPYYYVKMEQAKDGNMEEAPLRYQFGSATAWLGRMGEDSLADVAAWAVRLPGDWTFRNNMDDFFFAVLMGDPSRPPRSPREAGLDPSLILASPTARVFMQNRWGDYNATFLMHSLAEWSCLRTNGETMNSVFIYKNGGTLLTHKSGYRHDYGYDNRYNIVRPYEPGDRPNLSTATFGGQGCDRRWIDTTRFTDPKGFLRAAQIEPGKYGYTAGDASKFLSDRTRKWPNPTGYITSSDRQLVWFPSIDGKDYFLLFDRVTTDGVNVQPHLIFNTVEEPVVSRSFDTTIPKSAMDSRVIGHWIVKDAPAVTITNDEPYGGTRGFGTRPPAHARMFFQVLLPARPTIHLLGGTGGAFTPDGVDVTYGMEVNDQLETTDFSRLNGEGATSARLGCGLDKPCDSRTLGGLWRFHVVNQNLEKENRYLMAMETTDSGQLRPTGTMTLLEGQGIVGAAVANTIGLFNPVYQPLLSGRVTLPQTLILPDGATGYRLLIADLEPRAVYSLILGSIEQTATASEAGTIYLEGVTLHPGDTLTLAKIGVAPPPPPPVVRGDVNQDGVVNLRDAIQLLRWITGQPGRPEPGTDRFIAADINRDGRLTLADFICLLRGIVAGGTLPC